MEATIKEKIVVEINRKIQATNLSGNKASKVIGISNATLSNMLNKKWDSISDDLWRLAQSWTGYRIGWNLTDTSNVRRVFNICKDAQNNKKALAISDEPGSGKTAALKWYASVNSSVVYVECEEYWSKKILLQKILQAMGEDVEGGVAMMVDRIVERMNSVEKPLLILDEVDKLKDSALQIFKTLYNKTEDNAGFVLSGAPYFRERIIKGCNKNKQAYKEIRSRIGGQLLELNKVSENDIQKIAGENGIDPSEFGRIASKVGAVKDLRVIRRIIETHLLEKQVMRTVA